MRVRQTPTQKKGKKKKRVPTTAVRQPKDDDDAYTAGMLTNQLHRLFSIKSDGQSASVRTT